MRQFSAVFIVLIILCTLISCEKVEKIDIVPTDIMSCNVYTAEIQEGFETPHYAVFTIVCYEVGAYVPRSQYKIEYPLETPAMTFAGHPIYNNGDTINVKITEHRKTDVKGELLIVRVRTEVAFIGFCTQGTYTLNVNGFEQEFSVGDIK